MKQASVEQLLHREALEAGEIDLYWEYTGTALINYFGMDVITDPEECYQLVKSTDLEQNGLVWLDYTQFNNTYALMMRRADAEALVSHQLATWPRLLTKGWMRRIRAAGYLAVTTNTQPVMMDIREYSSIMGLNLTVLRLWIMGFFTPL
jgi:hypothetical protein